MSITIQQAITSGGSGTVTSVAISGSDGIEVDSGSPITTSGTIALGLNKANTLTFLNVEDGADVTDTTNVTAAGALMDSEVSSLSGIKTLTVPDSTTISTFGASLVDDTDAGTARTTLGLGTIATQAASSVTITGGSITGITDLALADGGTGASLADPNDDRIMFWDDSAGAVTWLDIGDALTISTTTLNLNINGMTAMGAFPSATNDYIAIYDGSAGTNLKITPVNFFKNIFGLTADASPDRSTDLLVTYDASAAAAKKITLDQVTNLADDSTPQLGGNLDVNGNSIVSASNGNIPITPNGTGKVILDGLNWPTADGSAGQLLKTDGAGNLSFVDAAGGGSSETVLMTGYKAGNYYGGHGFRQTNTGTGVSQTANTLYARPLILPVSGTFDRISTYVKTASSGHSIRIGIYEMSSGGLPSTLVADLGTVSVATTGLKEITISQALTANKGYFIAWVGDGTPQLAAQAVDATFNLNTVGTNNTTALASYAYTIAHTYGALPDPYGTPTGATGAGGNIGSFHLRSA